MENQNPMLPRRNFFKKTVAFLVASASGKLIGESEEVQTLKEDKKMLLGHSWENWAKTVKFKPDEIESPDCLEDLQELVAESSSVRAVGTGHSFNRALVTEGTLIKTKNLKKVLQLDSSGLVKVEGGYKLHDFNDYIWKKGYCFPSLGDIDRQALAGLVSTSTHGTGMKWGTLSDESTLKGMELITASGELLSLSSTNPADVEMLRAARSSLGMLGLIYSATFQMAKAHNLHLATKKMTLNEALDSRHWKENDHYEFFYFPYTDKTQGIFRNQTAKPPCGSSIKNWFNEIFMENIVLDVILKTRRPEQLPKMMNWLVGQLEDHQSIDRSYKIMTSVRTLKFTEMELGIPIEHVHAAVAEFQDLVQEFSNKGEDSYFVSLPLEVRFLRADRGTMLSHSIGRDTCYLSINLHTKFKNCEPFLRSFEQRLQKFSPRPHWGKVFFKNPLAHYPDAQKFLNIRQDLDPQGKFLNEFLLRVIHGIDNR